MARLSSRRAAATSTEQQVVARLVAELDCCRPRPRCKVIAMMRIALVVGLLAQSVAWPAEAPASFIVEWNAQLLATAEAEDGFMTLKGVRGAAMMHLAMHDALNATRHEYAPYALQMDAP